MFYLKKGDVDIHQKELRGKVEKFLNELILNNSKIEDFSSPQKKIASWRDRNKLSNRVQFQITGDEKGNAFISLFDVKRINTKKRQYKKTTLHIEDLWNEYNGVLTSLYEKGKMPYATFQRGYVWYKEKAMQSVQEKLLQYCQNNADEITRISQIDIDAYRRGIANEMLSFVNTKKTNEELIHNAISDPDHFAHNIAWRSLLAKIENNQLSLEQNKKITRHALILLSHPSVICRNKALHVIDLGLQKKYLNKTELRSYAKTFREYSKSPNPIIFRLAKKINRALGKNQSANKGDDL